jgi:hypothetical protein
MYVRNFQAGICLELIKEFDKELTGQDYSVLPLVRLCETNASVSSGLEVSAEEKLISCTSLAENMLKRAADKVTGEVMTRPGLGVDTVDSSGNMALSRPANPHREALGQATKSGVKRKKNETDEDTDRRSSYLCPVLSLYLILYYYSYSFNLFIIILLLFLL